MMSINSSDDPACVIVMIVVSALAYFLAPTATAEAQTAQCRGARTITLGPPGRIVGGSRANAADWPHFAALRLRVPETDMAGYFCGGTIIDRNWVMTAAHCLTPGFADHNKLIANTTDAAFRVFHNLGIKGKGKLEIVIGAGRLDNVEAKNVFVATKAVIHPRYRSASHQEDIALLKLDRPWSCSTATLAAADAGPPEPGQTLMVTGFGAQWEGAPTVMFQRSGAASFAAGSDILLEAALPAIAEKDCASVYGTAIVTSRQVCAGFDGGDRDSCQGDSGGPLVAFDAGGCPYQVGLVSWGKGCARAKSYGVYTRISHHRGWMAEVIAREGAGAQGKAPRP